MGGNFSWRMLFRSYNSQRKNCRKKMKKGKLSNFHEKKLTHRIFLKYYLYPWKLSYNNYPLFSPLSLVKKYSHNSHRTHKPTKCIFLWKNIHSISFIGLDIFGFHFSHLLEKHFSLFFTN